MTAVLFLMESDHKLAMDTHHFLPRTLNVRTLSFRTIYSAQTTKMHFKSHCLSRNALLNKANIEGTPSHERKTTSNSGRENSFRRRWLNLVQSLTHHFRPKDRSILSSAYFNLRRKAIGIAQCGIAYCCFKNKYQL